VLSSAWLFGIAFKAPKDAVTRPLRDNQAEAVNRADPQQEGKVERPDLRPGPTGTGATVKSKSSGATTVSGGTTDPPVADSGLPKPADSNPTLPKPSEEDRRREICAEFAETEHQAEQDALELHPKPKGPNVTLVDEIKANNARREYVTKRLKDAKDELVERYRISRSELEALIREGKSKGWPKTRRKP
jgi:hypothetical protein